MLGDDFDDDDDDDLSCLCGFVGLGLCKRLVINNNSNKQNVVS